MRQHILGTRFRSVVGAVLVLFPTYLQSQAAEVTVLVAGGISPALKEIAPRFESAAGQKVVLNTVSGGRIRQSIDAGAPFDVVVSLPSLIDELIKEGKVIAATRTDIARSGIGVAVRAGAPKPDISSIDALRQTLLKAKSVAYSAGASGAHFVAILDRLNIAAEVKPKLVPTPPGAIVIDALVKDEAELAVSVTSAILDPRVELVGLLPSELQSYIYFAGAVSTTVANNKNAVGFLRFITGPTATTILSQQGLEPVSSK